MKTESLEDFIKRGGIIKKPKYQESYDKIMTYRGKFVKYPELKKENMKNVKKIKD